LGWNYRQEYLLLSQEEGRGLGEGTISGKRLEKASK